MSQGLDGALARTHGPEVIDLGPSDFSGPPFLSCKTGMLMPRGIPRVEGDESILQMLGIVICAPASCTLSNCQTHSRSFVNLCPKASD